MKHRDFAVISGAKRKTETWENNVDETGTLDLLSPEESKKLATDPFYKLEQSNLDKQKAKEQSIPHLETLVDFQEKKKDDFMLSYIARKKFRSEKKEAEAMLQEGASKGFNNIKILPKDESDAKAAATIISPSLSSKHSLLQNSIKRKLEVKSKSIFGDTYSLPSQSADKEKLVDAIAKKRALGLNAKLQLADQPLKKQKVSISSNSTANHSATHLLSLPNS